MTGALVTIFSLCLSPALNDCIGTHVPGQGQVQYTTGNDVCHVQVTGRINAPWPQSSWIYGFTSCTALEEN